MRHRRRRRRLRTTESNGSQLLLPTSLRTSPGFSPFLAARQGGGGIYSDADVYRGDALYRVYRGLEADQVLYLFLLSRVQLPYVNIHTLAKTSQNSLRKPEPSRIPVAQRSEVSSVGRFMLLVLGFLKGITIKKKRGKLQMPRSHSNQAHGHRYALSRVPCLGLHPFANRQKNHIYGRC